MTRKKNSRNGPVGQQQPLLPRYEFLKAGESHTVFIRHDAKSSRDDSQVADCGRSVTLL